MRTGSGKYILVFFLWALPACYSAGDAAHYSALNENYSPSPWKKIVVLPFSGDPRFNKIAAEWFAHHVQKQSHFSIVTPTYAEIELKKQGILLSPKELSLEEALKAGRLLDADALLIGKVEAVRRARFAVKIRIQLVDVEKGETVVTGTTGNPNYFLKWSNIHEYVKIAIDKAGENFLIILENLAEGKLSLSRQENSPANQDADL